MLIKITCMCGKTSEWDFQDKDTFRCSCGKKINISKIFIKNKFKFAVLDNPTKNRKWVRIVPFLDTFLTCGFISIVTGPLIWLILIPRILATFARKRLVKKGYSVIGVAKQKGLEPDARTLHIQPKGRKHSIQIC